MANRPGFDPIILAALFVAAIVLDGIVLYFVEAPGSRLLLGLLVLAPIMWPIIWATRHYGPIAKVSDKVSDHVHKRRFLKLRRQVEQLLEEVKRLNWMAVDVQRGFRKAEDTATEVEAIKRRIMTIVDRIPQVAGHVAPDDAGTPEQENVTSGAAAGDTGARA